MDIDLSRLDDAAAEADFSGVASRHTADQEVLVRCYGFADRARGLAPTPDTRFGVASGAKGFTALAVLRLVELGVLTLTEPVRRWLGDDLPLVDDAVTLEHLLTHTSGIGDYLDEDGDGEITDHVLRVPLHTLAETEGFVPVLDGHPQVFAPGERFAYCNGGFVLAALVAERASGRGFHELVEEEVCARAGLLATGFPRSDEPAADIALGYLDDGPRTNVLHLPVRGNGDGGLVTTAADLHLFWRALIAGSIVSAEHVEAMTRPRNDAPDEGLRYGMGLWLAGEGPELILEGYDAGVSFRSTHDPRTATTTSVLGNTSEGAWPVIGALIEEAADD